MFHLTTHSQKSHSGLDRPVLFFLARLWCWRRRRLSRRDAPERPLKGRWGLVRAQLPRHALELSGLLRCRHLAFHCWEV